MGKKKTPQIGEKFGRLTVIGEPYFTKTHRRVECQCEEGNIVTPTISQLYNGGVKSCGCLRRELSRQAKPNQRTHGMSRTKLYNAWRGMHDRCYNKNSLSYPDYGGRGIKIADEWNKYVLGNLAAFENFKKWASANGFTDDTSLDRRNNNGDYGSENCRWVDQQTQLNNRRSCVYIEAFGKRMTAMDWTRDPICVVCYEALISRVQSMNWPVEEALTTPSDEVRKSRQLNYIDVVFSQITKNFRPRVKLTNGNWLFIGYFDNEIEAAKYRDQYIRENNIGDLNKLNFQESTDEL